MSEIYRTNLKNNYKWMISHTRRVLRNIKDEPNKNIYDEFFFDLFTKDQQARQGDIGEVFVDFDHRHIITREDINATGYKPATKDQDYTQHFDSEAWDWIFQFKNTRHLDLFYNDKGRSNVFDFLAEAGTYDNEHKKRCIVTTARRDAVNELIKNRYRVTLICREDIEPWVTESALKEFIEYLKRAQEHFAAQRTTLLEKAKDDKDNRQRYDYQQKWYDHLKQAYTGALGGRYTVDASCIIGQGGGKTDMEKDFIVFSLKEGIPVFLVAHRLKLINDHITDIVPKVLIIKGLSHTKVNAFGSRKEWTIEKDGFDINTYSAGALEPDDVDALFKNGSASLNFITYDQLGAITDHIEKHEIKANIVFDEIASQVPRVIRLNKDKEKKHWANVKRARTVFFHKAYFDANWTKKMEDELQNKFIRVLQKDLIEVYGSTVPLDIIESKQIGKLPKELQQLELKEQQKVDVGHMMYMIMEEVDWLTKNTRDSYSSQGIVYNTDAKSCKIIENYLKSWIESQQFGKPVNIGSFTSHQSVTEQDRAMAEFDSQEGVNILLSKNMLSRGVNKRRLQFGALFDTRHEEELSHTFTRLNRRDDRDGFEPEAKVHKPRARWYIPKSDNYEYLTKILVDLQTTGITCGNIIVDDGQGNKRTIAIEKYIDPDYDTIKSVKGTSLQKVFQTRLEDIEKMKQEKLKEQAQKAETLGEILDYLKDDVTETV